MKVIVLSLFFAVVSASAANFEGRIYNGVKTVNGEFPYVLSVAFFGSHVCAATSLTNTWVLTAAQCIFPGLPSSIGLYGGSVDLNPNAGYFINAVRLLTHPEYESGINPYEYDAGVPFCTSNEGGMCVHKEMEELIVRHTESI
uniref:Peptidase S1 domain-containing protein n=1 Tax=Lutzomyia longipalpis TaxID=7200 RepID=A0A1B0CRL2_LUTLO